MDFYLDFLGEGGLQDKVFLSATQESVGLYVGVAHLV